MFEYDTSEVIHIIQSRLYKNKIKLILEIFVEIILF